LAIELAAVLVRSLTVAQIATRLEDRFRLLFERPRASPPRHQTLRGAVDWSYELLAEAERVLFNGCQSSSVVGPSKRPRRSAPVSRSSRLRPCSC